MTWKNHKIKLLVRAIFQLLLGTTPVLPLIQKPPKSALKLGGSFNPCVGEASLQVTRGVFEQLLAAPQPRLTEPHPSAELHQRSLTRIWRCATLHSPVLAYTPARLSMENLPQRWLCPVLHLQLFLP